MLFRNRLAKLSKKRVFSITEELDTPRERSVDANEETDFQAQALAEIQSLKDEIKQLGKAQLHITKMVEAYQELIDSATKKLLEKIDEIGEAGIKPGEQIEEDSEESQTNL